MSQKTQTRVNETLERNAIETLHDGGRLTYTKLAVNGARCPSGKHVLRVGLGGMGVGQMWFDYREPDPLFEELPIDDCGNGCVAG